MNEPKAAWPFPNLKAQELNMSPADKAMVLVLAERHLQRKMWTPEHDAQNDFEQWQLLLVELITDRSSTTHTNHEILTRVAATAMAALEADFRKEEGL